MSFYHMNLKSANNVNAPLKPPPPLCRSGCYFHTRDLARSWRARGRLPFFGFKCAGREKMRARRQQAERHETVHVEHGARTDLQPCAGPRVVAEVARQHQTLRNKLQPAARCGTLLVNIGAWLRYRLYRRIRSSLIASGEAYIVDRVVERRGWHPSPRPHHESFGRSAEPKTQTSDSKNNSSDFAQRTIGGTI